MLTGPPGLLSSPDTRGWLSRAFGPGPNGLLCPMWTNGIDPNNNALIYQLRDEGAYLRDENRRKDEIIMQQAMTMQQLAAAQPQEEPPEAAETVEEEPEGAEPRSGAGEAHEGVQRRWW